MPCRNRLTNGSRLCANGELFWYDYFAFPTRTVYAIDARIRCASICRRCASTELDFESCNSSLSEQSALSTARAVSLVKHVQRQDLLWAAQHLLFIAIIRLSQESRSRLHLEYLNRCGLACVRSRRNV